MAQEPTATMRHLADLPRDAMRSVQAANNVKHLLVVDDDREIRSLLGEYLAGNGYRVTVAADGRAMRKAMGQGHVDLVVLDLMLPGEDGLSLCRALRVGDRTPVIMLTARGAEVDRIVGLEMGADDYVAKPFNPRELLARIKSVLRRVEERSTDAPAGAIRRLHFTGWTLDVLTRDLTGPSGAIVSLTGAEFRLLQALLTHPNRVLSRNQLMDLTRGLEAEPFDRSIDVQISRLRQILRDEGRERRIIKTVYGEGYVLVVPVEQEMIAAVPPPQ